MDGNSAIWHRERQHTEAKEQAKRKEACKEEGQQAFIVRATPMTMATTPIACYLNNFGAAQRQVARDPPAANRRSVPWCGIMSH
jgi:hypothetical protein